MPLDFTTADRETLKRCYDAIASELGDDRFFTSKELDVLPKILSPMEQVLSFSSGLMDGNTWLIVLTDARVLFVDKGMIFGLKQTSIELSNIVSIHGETGLMFGTIRMGVANGTHEIRNVWKRTVNPFVNKVRMAGAARQRGEQLVSPGTDVTIPAALTPTPTEPAATPAPPRGEHVPVEARQPQALRPAQTPPVPTSSERQTAIPASNPDAAANARLERLLRAGSIDEIEYRRLRDS